MNLTRDEQNEIMLAAVKRIRDEARLALEADPDDHEALIRTVLAYCESVIRDVETSADRPPRPTCKESLQVQVGDVKPCG